MIELGPDQQDALIEICNVGMSKAAKQLSILLNDRVNISIPKITLLSTASLHEDVMFSGDKTFSLVYQNIKSDVNGKALVIFHRDNARLLTNSVIGNTPKLTDEERRVCEQEAMLEIGNIIISTCMSAIVNMLSEKVDLSVPHYREEKIKQLVNEEINSIDEFSDEIFLIATHLESATDKIVGSLLLTLTKDSTEHFFDDLNRLLGK